MNTKSFIIVPLLLLFAIFANAQSNLNEYHEYLNLTAMHLWMNNCEKAQKCYKIYKELSGASSEKMDVLIACECQGMKMNNYVILFDLDVLYKYLRSLEDSELFIRVLSMYSDPDERVVKLREMANYHKGLARFLNGGGWYESISVQKKL